MISRPCFLARFLTNIPYLFIDHDLCLGLAFLKVAFFVIMNHLRHIYPCMDMLRFSGSVGFVDSTDIDCPAGREGFSTIACGRDRAGFQKEQVFKKKKNFEFSFLGIFDFLYKQRVYILRQVNILNREMSRSIVFFENYNNQRVYIIKNSVFALRNILENEQGPRLPYVTFSRRGFDFEISYYRM